MKTRATVIRIALVIALTAGFAAGPAGAACVTAGAYYRSSSGSTVGLPPGTCIVPTPLGTGTEHHYYVANPATGGVGVAVGVPLP
jgi:hypothetical protein